MVAAAHHWVSPLRKRTRGNVGENLMVIVGFMWFFMVLYSPVLLVFFYPEKMLDVTDLSNTYGDVTGCNTMYWNNKSQ